MTLRSRRTTETCSAHRAAGGAEVAAAVLDHDEVVAVDLPVAVALAVAAALLGDREVEADAVDLRARQLDRVLLCDRETELVRTPRDQPRVGQRRALAERHVIRARRAVEARPRVEVVVLDGVEALARAGLDHRLQEVGDAAALGACGDVEQVLAAPVGVVAQLAQHEVGRPLGVGLRLERVDVTDGVAAPRRLALEPVARDDAHPVRRRVRIADLVVEARVDRRRRERRRRGQQCGEPAHGLSPASPPPAPPGAARSGGSCRSASWAARRRTRSCAGTRRPTGAGARSP